MRGTRFERRMVASDATAQSSDMGQQNRVAVRAGVQAPRRHRHSSGSLAGASYRRFAFVVLPLVPAALEFSRPVRHWLQPQSDAPLPLFAGVATGFARFSELRLLVGTAARVSRTHGPHDIHNTLRLAKWTDRKCWLPLNCEQTMPKRANPQLGMRQVRAVFAFGVSPY